MQMGVRDRKWFEEHPVASAAPPPYANSYRICSTRELRLMLTYLSTASAPEPLRRRDAILAHIKMRERERERLPVADIREWKRR